MFIVWVNNENDPTNIDIEPLPSDFIVTENISLDNCYKIREYEYEFWSEDTKLDSGTCSYGEIIKLKGSNPTKKLIIDINIHLMVG